MKPLALALAAALACAAAPVEAGARARPCRTDARDALIRLIADATAWSEMCVNYAVDPVAVAHFRDVHRIRMDGPYIKTFGFAYARQHAAAYDQHTFRNACARALALYGPDGSLAPGLVRPLFHGTVPGQKINLDRW